MRLKITQVGGAPRYAYVKIEVVPDDADNSASNKYITYPMVELGDNFTMAIRANGDVYTWGNNNYGQLGLGYMGFLEIAPQKITGLSNIKKITVC